jgi:hypothetical protein
VVLGAYTWARGPLGDYYQPTTEFLNLGSRTNNAAGLAHYTVSTNQVKDTGRVEIGLHYVACPTVYDAKADFLTGTNGPVWFYGRTSSLTTNDYTNLPSYDAGNQCWDGSGDTYCMVGAYWQHPGDSYNSVRRWLAPWSGTVSLRSQVRNPTGCYPTTDGVKVRVLKNLQPLLDWMPVVVGTVYLPVDFNVAVQAGDTLDFQVKKNGSNPCDTTWWTPTINYLELADADRDGLPDYLEDRDGDGTYDSGAGAGETNWNDYNSVNRLVASPWFEVFTPLQ